MIFALTTVIVALLANIGVASASSLAAPFGINSGTQGNNNVVWVDGQNACFNVIIGPVGTNPCGRPLSINGQGGLTFENCGGDNFFINQNGKLFATCGPLHEADQGGCNNGINVHSSFHCI